MNHLRQLGGHHQNPFSGKVTDFNMWGRSFTKEELVSFTTCKTEKLATLKREAKGRRLDQPQRRLPGFERRRRCCVKRRHLPQRDVAK